MPRKFRTGVYRASGKPVNGAAGREKCGQPVVFLEADAYKKAVRVRPAQAGRFG